MKGKRRLNLEARPCKKPAKQSKGKKKGMARPASASAVKKILKRPAAVAASSAAGDMSEGGYTDRRDTLLKKIPKNVLQRHKGGCSRCYHRAYCTVSCWARRGYK